MSNTTSPEFFEAREVPLGGVRGVQVDRVLPQRELPTLGAWCFLDQFGPDVAEMVVLPHPHIGLQTVTWPLAGEIRHRDSVGSDVILRPGQIFGGGIPLITGAVARQAAGRWVVLGDGKLELPLVYIDDVVDAIIAAIDKKLVGGEVFQIIDPEHLTQDDVLQLAGGEKPVIKVPRPIVFALGKLSELPLRVLGKQSPIASYRLKSALARLHYASDYAERGLGWKPRVGVREGIRRVTP